MFEFTSGCKNGLTSMCCIASSTPCFYTLRRVQTGRLHWKMQYVQNKCILSHIHYTSFPHTDNIHKTLNQTHLQEYPQDAQGVQIPLNHGILQLIMTIAFCCILHHQLSRDIHCWSLCKVYCRNSQHTATRSSKTNQWMTATSRQRNLQAHKWLPMNSWMTRTPNIRTTTISPSSFRVFPHRCANDPSAGSPTETLLRLLLPLSDKVH